jgi:hypothetical protein
MKETFIEPILHPFSSSSTCPSTPRNHYRDYDEFPHADSPQESLEQLPIASRFMSPLGFRPETPTSPLGTRKDDTDKDTPNIDGESLDSDEDEEGDDQLGRSYTSRAQSSQAAKHSHPRSPYRATATRTSGRSGGPVPFPTSHQSLPPSRANPASSTNSLSRQSTIQDRERKFSQGSVERKMAPTQGSRVLRKFRKSQTASDAALVGGAVPPHQLPEDLRICLEAIESGIMEGHMKLSEGLRKRYDEQYPLVRSLADVFVTHVSGRFCFTG